MARPAGSSRISTTWQLRVSEATRLLQMFDKALAADPEDQAAQSRRPNIHKAITALNKLTPASTNRDATDACQLASKYVLYALSLRRPADQ